MRKVVLAAGVVAMAAGVSACGKRGYDRARPDEFAVARQAPLVIPPDFALVPPTPGAARAQAANPQAQAVQALFGPAARTPGSAALVQQAGGTIADPGIRSQAGDPGTNVIDKGQTTRDILAAPQGDGQGARATAGASASAPAASATPTP